MMCVVLVRAPLIASDSSIIYGAGDGAEATGTAQRRLAVASATGSRHCHCKSSKDWTRSAHDTLCPVALRAPALLSVLLWQSLSQQQRPP